MKLIALTNTLTGKIIFEGHFNSLTECLETAVTENIALTGLDMSFKNLSNANLDNATISGCIFKNTNLCGANLSESKIVESDFTNALLCNTCICETDLEKNDFSMALFGGTDIAGSRLSDCKFSTLSSLDLNYYDASVITNCIFECPDKTQAVFNHAPIIVKGLFKKTLAVFDEKIKFGTSLYAKENALNFFTETIRIKSI